MIHLDVYACAAQASSLYHLASPHHMPPHQAEQHINDMLGEYRLLLEPYWELLKLPPKYQVGSVL